MGAQDVVLENAADMSACFLEFWPKRLRNLMSGNSLVARSRSSIRAANQGARTGAQAVRMDAAAASMGQAEA
jgi:hypothetical protein